MSRLSFLQKVLCYSPTSKTAMLRRRLAAGWIALVCCAAAGCGGAYDSTVTGDVTLDNSVITGGTVAFHPTAGGPIGYAPIGSDGSYLIRTGDEEGLPSGQYQVTVLSNETSTELETKDAGPKKPGKSITPDWYRSKETSGLYVTVAPGRNKINLELNSQPPPGWKPGGRRS